MGSHRVRHELATRETEREVLIHVEQKCSFFSIPVSILSLDLLIHDMGMSGLMSHLP